MSRTATDKTNKAEARRAPLAEAVPAALETARTRLARAGRKLIDTPRQKVDDLAASLPAASRRLTAPLEAPAETMRKAADDAGRWVQGNLVCARRSAGKQWRDGRRRATAQLRRGLDALPDRFKLAGRTELEALNQQVHALLEQVESIHRRTTC